MQTENAQRSGDLAELREALRAARASQAASEERVALLEREHLKTVRACGRRERCWSEGMVELELWTIGQTVWEEEKGVWGGMADSWTEWGLCGRELEGWAGEGRGEGKECV